MKPNTAYCINGFVYSTALL